MANKVTKRVLFETLKTLCEDGTFTCEIGTDSDEVITEQTFIDFCEKEIAALDRKSAKAKEAAAAKKSASDELTEAIFDVLTEDFTSIADITAKIENEDVTVAKCQYRLNKLVEAGRAVKNEMVVGGGEGSKKRKVVGFALV